MHLFTNGYELTTAITNLLIFITTLFLLPKIKDNKTWKWFYYFITMDAFIGIIVHGIKMNNILFNTLWVILIIMFSITFNLLLHIFYNVKYKKIVLLSISLIIILLIEMVFKIYFIYTLLIYAILVVFICLYKIFKSNNKSKYYYLTGIIIQMLGVIPTFTKLSFKYLNYNGICHLFSLITIIIFYLGIKKES